MWLVPLIVTLIVIGLLYWLFEAFIHRGGRKD